MKKLLKTIMLIFISINILANVTFATDYTTSYCPAKDALAKQPEGAPWCLFTCMKIVLKDISEKHKSNPSSSERNAKINSILINIPEINMLEKVFVKNCATIKMDNLNKFSPTQRSKMRIAMQQLFDKDVVTTKKTKWQELNLENSGLLYNGLMNLETESELRGLLTGMRLTDDNVKKMFGQKSDRGLLDIVCNDIGLKYEIKDAQKNYTECFQDIIKQIKDCRRMVIIIFRNPINVTEQHACLAYKCDDSFFSNVFVFNPWGNEILINAYSTPSLININSNTGQEQMLWKIVNYITFDY